jgi:hypothetical protein
MLFCSVAVPPLKIPPAEFPNGAVIHCQIPRTIDDGATRSAAHSGTAVSATPADGVVVQRHCAAERIERTANTHLAMDAGAATVAAATEVPSAGAALQLSPLPPLVFLLRSGWGWNRDIQRGHRAER